MKTGPYLEHDDPELGRVRLCRRCGEEWPLDAVFWYFTATGKVLGHCRACWADKNAADYQKRYVA